jgi:molybdopterin/thiamine biosynthesis adenylyltransferase
MLERYKPMLALMDQEQLEKIRSSHVSVVGAGGLGGNVIEMLARLGVGTLVIIDRDSFEQSNLSRQILATERNLGCSKADEAVKRINCINSDVAAMGIPAYLVEENAAELLKGSEVVVDCLDSIESRRVLQKTCRELGIPLVHGAVDAWEGEVLTVMPGDDSLDTVYPRDVDRVEVSGNASFLPAMAASVQVSECVKLITGCAPPLQNTLLHINARSLKFTLIKLTQL